MYVCVCLFWMRARFSVSRLIALAINAKSKLACHVFDISINKFSVASMNEAINEAKTILAVGLYYTYVLHVQSMYSIGLRFHSRMFPAFVVP